MHSKELLALRDEYIDTPLKFKHYVSFTKEMVGGVFVRRKLFL